MRPSDANRTEGQTDWNAIDWRATNRSVRNLRQRIFRATQEGDWDKVQSLQRLMLRSRANVQQSVRRVTQVNPGKNTPGIDKVLVKTPAERGKLVDEMSNFTPWQAIPVKRVYIPKANGKQRPLGIPTIRDRVLQAMVKNALEPSWEAKFEGISYGFRPGRGAQDAIKQIWDIAKKKAKTWILDADISGCFDNINHEHLLDTIGPFPAKELIRQWLKAGYVEYGKLHETLTGTPQGGVISPLLANISLHGMETALGIRYQRKGNREPQRMGPCVVIRYADDFVVMCNTEQTAQKAQETLTQWLAVRGLQLSQEKTKITTLAKGVDFLGFHVRLYPSKLNKSGWKVLITPSQKSVQKIRKKLREEWLSLRGHNINAVIKRLNPIIRGWANYFRTQVSSKTFQNLDQYMYKREVRYAKHMHPHKSRRWHQNHYWGKLNLEREDFNVFGNKETGAYLFKFSWTGIQRHTMVTGTNSPDDASLDEYWLDRERAKVKTLQPKLGTLAKRQDGKCPICGESLFIDENIEQHHIVRRDENGPNIPDNKLLIHLYCHQQLTAFQNRKP
jgi:RNA-directed DNA polymerase